MRKSFVIAGAVFLALVALSMRDAIYTHFHGYVSCPAGTHQAHHVVDTYDLSPLGPGGAVAHHKIADVIPVEGVCWPDDKPGG